MVKIVKLMGKIFTVQNFHLPVTFSHRILFLSFFFLFIFLKFI